MRIATTVALVTGAAGAMAQVNPASLLNSVSAFLTPNCSAAITQLVTNSSIASCLHVDSLAPLLTSNGSVIPIVDDWLGDVCGSDPCSNETLASAASTIISSCSSDLSSFDIANETVYEVFGTYPLAREVVCLKTTEPYNSTNATIPINSTAYNNTNGTFCATSLLTELSSYLGTNLTVSYIATAALGGNTTALQIVESIPRTALCSDCIFAAVDLIEEAYPQLGDISVGNTTINGYLNDTCAAEGFNVTSDGDLPDTITESAYNSTYPFNVTAGNVTYTPGTPAVPTPPLNSSKANVTTRDVTAAKRRWPGQQ